MEGQFYFFITICHLVTVSLSEDCEKDFYYNSKLGMCESCMEICEHEDLQHVYKEHPKCILSSFCVPKVREKCIEDEIYDFATQNCDKCGMVCGVVGGIHSKKTCKIFCPHIGVSVPVGLLSTVVAFSTTEQPSVSGSRPINVSLGIVVFVPVISGILVIAVILITVLYCRAKRKAKRLFQERSTALAECGSCGGTMNIIPMQNMSSAQNGDLHRNGACAYPLKPDPENVPSFDSGVDDQESHASIDMNINGSMGFTRKKSTDSPNMPRNNQSHGKCPPSQSSRSTSASSRTPQQRSSYGNVTATPENKKSSEASIISADTLPSRSSRTSQQSASANNHIVPHDSVQPEDRELVSDVEYKSMLTGNRRATCDFDDDEKSNLSTIVEKSGKLSYDIQSEIDPLMPNEFHYSQDSDYNLQSEPLGTKTRDTYGHDPFTQADDSASELYDFREDVETPLHSRSISFSRGGEIQDSEAYLGKPEVQNIPLINTPQLHVPQSSTAPQYRPQNNNPTAPLSDRSETPKTNVDSLPDDLPTIEYIQQKFYTLTLNDWVKRLKSNGKYVRVVYDTISQAEAERYVKKQIGLDERQFECVYEP